MTWWTVRVRMPSRSRLRRVTVSMRWLILSTARLSSMKRRGPWSRRQTTRSDHLSPTVPRTTRAWPASCCARLLVGVIVTSREPGHRKVPY
ncbi:hypothetical protein SRIMM317S_02156 [Streptomyces rimosus subsp. rimosus]